jgi:hypothetical protein
MCMGSGQHEEDLAGAVHPGFCVQLPLSVVEELLREGAVKSATLAVQKTAMDGLNWWAIGCLQGLREGVD